MQVVFVPVAHETCEEKVFAESLTMLSTLTSMEILSNFLDVLDHHCVGSRTSFTSFVIIRAGRSSRETIPTVTTGSNVSLVNPSRCRTQRGLRLAVTR